MYLQEIYSLLTILFQVSQNDSKEVQICSVNGETKIFTWNN